MLFWGMAAVSPVIKGKPGIFPTEAMPTGAHAALRLASKHKQMVSAVLHLKKESVGKSNPTAYATGKKAFK